jgi:hypothetical protein
MASSKADIIALLDKLPPEVRSALEAQANPPLPEWAKDPGGEHFPMIAGCRGVVVSSDVDADGWMTGDALEAFRCVESAVKIRIRSPLPMQGIHLASLYAAESTRFGRIINGCRGRIEEIEVIAGKFGHITSDVIMGLVTEVIASHERERIARKTIDDLLARVEGEEDEETECS